MKHIVRFFTLFALSFIYGLSAQAAPSITVDLDSSRVLSHHEAFVPWHPASLTKMMTAFVTFRALDAGEIAPNTPVVISNLAIQQPASHTGYPKGTVMTVENALKLLVVKSANDIAVAIAETVSGTVPAFSARMNREAQQLGMKTSHFVNPHGLHNPRQIVSAYDIAILAQALHKRYPQYARLFSSPRVEAPVWDKKSKKTIQAKWRSYNLLLERFRGADGFKTGFICASGYNVAVGATRSGRRIVTVVLGRIAQNQRTIDAARNLTLAFQKPLTAGVLLSELKPTGQEPLKPLNIRSRICGKNAWKNRAKLGKEYNMATSPWLSPKQVTTTPLQVSLGNANGPASSTIAEAQLAVLLHVPTPKARPRAPEPIAGVDVNRRKVLTPTPAFRSTF